MSDSAERFETVIVGGGQAGLATGYHLRRLGQRFVILDAFERAGDAWRTRWDSLRLFTPARYDGLPGWRFPASPWSFPTKDELADYLEAYAARFELPVRTGVRVDGLTGKGNGFLITSGERTFEAQNVVVATGAHHVPKVPSFSFDLDPAIVQLHSKQYRNPSQLPEGPVLVVGLGNSGAEIAFEVARDHPTLLSGEPSAQIPFRHGGLGSRFFFRGLHFVGLHVLTRRTPIGRKLIPKLSHKALPLIRVKVDDLVAAGVERVPRVVGARDGLPHLDDGRALEVASVIWCTGFRMDHSWIDLPIFGDDGAPRHQRGVVSSEPGMYFVGLRFQYSEGSDVIPGVGRDARFIAKAIASRTRKRRPSGEEALAAA